jgi:hypothetical protein
MRSYLENTQHKKGLAESLPSKREDQSSNPSIRGEKKKKKKKL